MERLIAPNLILHALACGRRCCAERPRGRRIVILDHILKPWQGGGYQLRALANYDRASLRQGHWVHGCLVDDGRLLHVLWQATESVHGTSRCWNCSGDMAGCLPLSQWLSTLSIITFHSGTLQPRWLGNAPDLIGIQQCELHDPSQF